MGAKLARVQDHAVRTEPDDAGPLLLVDGLEPFCVVLETGFQRLDQGPLVLRDLLQAVAQADIAAIFD